MTRIVEDDVDATELLFGVLEGCDDIVFVGNVDLEDVEFVGGVFGLEIVQGRGFAEGGDRDVPVVQDGLGHRQTDAGGCAGD